MVGARPSGTVTFLFTDIEGSTRLWEEHRDRMEAALARHDELLRTAIESHDGYVFATGGDGFAAAFSRAEDATNAAIQGQASLDAAFGDGPVPLRVRMGLHTGVASERDGDYFGTAVNRAARVMQAGNGRQVVLSAATRSLLDEHAIRTIDAGEHRLEGLTLPEQLHVVERDDGTSAATLRSPRRSAGHLPASISLFVGRGPELDATMALVRERSVVTLTGIGGAGKTRLALEVATALRGEFGDGAWFVDLAAISDPDDTIGATANALDVVLQPGEDPLRSLASSLSARDALVLLDNCEHVLDEAAAIVDAVAGRGGAPRFLVTSREGLSIQGEVIRSVAPMGADPGQDGFELFVSRVRDHDPDFEPQGGDAAAVTELCKRLDGIPLAIELAAARARSMSTREVLAGLDDRFRLLAGSRRRGVRRHQTMLEAIGWSYELLDDDEAVMLRSLATLVGTFDASAAMAVADAEPFGIGLLESLVDKSLVRIDRTGPSARYQLLETVRDFAAEQLRAHSETAIIEHRHQQHFIDVVARLGEELAGPRYVDAVAELRLARPNLANAMVLAVDEADTQAAVALCAPLAAMGGVSLERPDTNTAIAAASLSTIERSPRGDGVFTVALLGAYQRGDFDLAREIRALGSEWEREHGRSAELQAAQCFTAWWEGLDVSVAHGTAGADAAREQGDQVMLSTALSFTALSYWIHDRLEDAKPVAAEAAAIARDIPSPLLELLSAFAVANAHCSDGDQEAIDRYVRCLELADSLGHMAMSGNCLLHLSLLAPDDDPALAVRLAAGAIRRYDRQTATELGMGLIVMARALLLAERPEEAAVLVAGARARLPWYFSIPWGVNRTAPVETAIRHALGERHAAAAAVGEATDVRELVALSQRLATELAPAPST